MDTAGEIEKYDTAEVLDHKLCLEVILHPRIVKPLAVDQVVDQGGGSHDHCVVAFADLLPQIAELPQCQPNKEIPAQIKRPISIAVGKVIEGFSPSVKIIEDKDSTIIEITDSEGVKRTSNIRGREGEDGEDAVVVRVFSSNGNIFKEGAISTILTASAHRADVDISESIASNFYSWERASNNPITDKIFNQTHRGHGRELILTPDDVFVRATFNCIISL